jgi:hypothetical protein
MQMYKEFYKEARYLQGEHKVKYAFIHSRHYYAFHKALTLESALIESIINQTLAVFQKT